MRPPKDDLFELITESISSLSEQSVVAITSKVLAIHQGRTIPMSEEIDRETLAIKESDLYIPKDIVPGEHIMFTIKDNILIASAGIDASNADDHWILWPTNSHEASRELHTFLCDHYGVTNLGVIITDSRIMMLRRGTLGISLGHFGFNPVRNYVGTPDIFGRLLKVSVSNLADAMAVAAVLAMGEGKEQTPIAIIEGVDLQYSTDPIVNKGQPEFVVPLEEDLFSPMISAVPWQKGGGGKS